MAYKFGFSNLKFKRHLFYLSLQILQDLSCDPTLLLLFHLIAYVLDEREKELLYSDK